MLLPISRGGGKSTQLWVRSLEIMKHCWVAGKSTLYLSRSYCRIEVKSIEDNLEVWDEVCIREF